MASGSDTFSSSLFQVPTVILGSAGVAPHFPGFRSADSSSYLYGMDSDLATSDNGSINGRGLSAATSPTQSRNASRRASMNDLGLLSPERNQEQTEGTPLLLNKQQNNGGGKEDDDHATNKCCCVIL